VFTIDDLWRIMEYLKDGTTDSRLSELTTTLATSEKEITTTFFEQVLDQETFNSEDYRRLRAMLIDLYSSHKTIATTQKYASDVHQLPDKHLSELFKSFGFPHGLDLVPLTSKANFFLDLVNFYKKKGTPETLVDVLDYYGFSDTDLVEYWLQKDEFGNIIFKGESVRTAATGSTLLLDSNVSFEKMTSSDPHWFQSKLDIENLLLTNKINLPSKSPYYSLSSIFSLFTITISLTILFRVVQDQYDRYLLDQELPYNVQVKNLGMLLPILHVYVGAVYAFEKMFGNSTATSFTNYGCYNGIVEYQGNPPIALHLSDLVDEYEQLITRPSSRLDRDTRLATLLSDWSRPLSNNFLNSIKASEPLLQTMNPEFKAVIDSWFNVGDQSYLVSYLIGTLDNWIRLNINSKAPSLVITMLGLGFREELDSIINFFKPYRARIAFMDTAFAIQNPLEESVILDEWLMTSIEGFYHDAIRPLNLDGDFCSNNGFGGSTPWIYQLCGVDGPEPIVEEPPPDPTGDDWYEDEFGNPQFRFDLGASFDSSPHTQMDQDYLDELEANDPTSPPEPEPEPLDWIYDDDDNGKLMYRYDLETVFDIDPDSQMDLDYRERIDAAKPPEPPEPPTPIEYPGPGYAGYCSAYRWDMDTSFDIPPSEQMDDDYYIRLGEYMQSLHIGTICDYVSIDIELNFVDIIGGNEGGTPVVGDYDTGAFYDVTSYWVESVKIFFGQDIRDDIEFDDQFIIQFDVEAFDDFGKEWPTQMDTGAGFDTMVTKSPVTDLLIIDVSSVASAHCTTDVGGNYKDFDSQGNYDSLADLQIGVPEPLSGTVHILFQAFVPADWVEYDNGGVYDIAGGGLVIGHYELSSSTINITTEVTIADPDIYIGLYGTIDIETTYGGVQYNYDTGSNYDSLAYLNLGIFTSLSGSSNSRSDATTTKRIFSNTPVVSNVMTTDLIVGRVEFMSARPFCGSYVRMNLDMEFGVIEELTSSISFTSIVNLNMELGSDTILESTSASIVNIISDLTSGDEEALSSTINVVSDIQGNIDVTILLAMTNVVSSVDSDLTIGRVEGMWGRSSCTTNVYTLQELWIGFKIEQLTSSCVVESSIENIVILGINENMTSTSNSISNIITDLTVGYSEGLTSTCVVNSNVVGAFYIMILGTANCGTNASTIGLVFGIAKELLSSVNAANTVTDAELMIGLESSLTSTCVVECNIVVIDLVNASIEGSVNISSNIIDSYIVTGVNYAIIASSESVTIIDGELTIGIIEILSTASNSTTTFDSELIINAKVLTSNSESVTAIDGNLTVV